MFKCTECGKEQRTITQQEIYSRHANDYTEYEYTTYLFECGHIVYDKHDLVTVERPAINEHRLVKAEKFMRMDIWPKK